MRNPMLITAPENSENRKYSNVGEERWAMRSIKRVCSSASRGARILRARLRRAGGSFSGSSGMVSALGMLIGLFVQALSAVAGATNVPGDGMDG
jgi:hypothetical protein